MRDPRRSFAVTTALCALALASSGYAPPVAPSPGRLLLEAARTPVLAAQPTTPVPCEAFPLHDFPPGVLALALPPAIDLERLRGAGALAHADFGRLARETVTEAEVRLSVRTVVVRARIGERGQVAIVRGPEHLVDTREVGSLARELRYPAQLVAGTELRLVYRVAGDDAASHRLTALEVGSKATARRAFYVEGSERWPAGFYTRDGSSVGGGFLRFPVEYVHITSKFSPARHHPILKRRKPHNGVDFAARRGTPVLAVADGEVVAAGWDGRNGRAVRIAHVADYESRYAHLNEIAGGIRPGTKVRKGQILGTVGSTGMSTGPHLHFGLSIGGRYVDPLGPEVPSTPSLDSARLVVLRAEAARADELWRIAEREAERPVHVARR